MLNGGKRHLGIFAIILLLIGAYFFLIREDHQKKMGELNRYELGVLNELIEKKQFFRDSLKDEMDSVMLQLHKNTDYSDEFRYYTNRRMPSCQHMLPMQQLSPSPYISGNLGGIYLFS